MGEFEEYSGMFDVGVLTAPTLEELHQRRIAEQDAELESLQKEAAELERWNKDREYEEFLKPKVRAFSLD